MRVRELLFLHCTSHQPEIAYHLTCKSSSGIAKKECHAIYCAGIPWTTSQGYQYSWFCDQSRNWLVRGFIDATNTSRWEKLFVDYAAKPAVLIHVLARSSAQIFVAVLGLPITPMLKPPVAILTGLDSSHQRSFTFFVVCLNWLSPITCAQAHQGATYEPT